MRAAGCVRFNLGADLRNGDQMTIPECPLARFQEVETCVVPGELASTSVRIYGAPASTSVRVYGVYLGHEILRIIDHARGMRLNDASIPAHITR